MFSSKRSVVMARRGMVATSQPLAAQAGLQILDRGGSAADAAVAVAAVLNVVEPMSTGVGGDMFALTYNAKTGELRALNGSGRSAGGASLAAARQMGLDAIPEAYHGLAVSVPGAVDGWLTLLGEYGHLPLKDVFAPAIYYAQAGFPVSPIIALMWQRAEEKLRQDPIAADAFLLNGQAPRAGHLFKQSALADIFHLIIRDGRQAIYEGSVAEGIARTVQAYQGLLTTDDLAAHHSTWDQPIDITYRDHRLVECPPNGQGIIALQVLGMLEPLTLSARSFGQADVLHYQIEAVKLAFADAYHYVADPRVSNVPVAELLSADYLAQRRAQINPRQASPGFSYGNPFAQTAHSDTVYLSVVDGNGLAVSFINSLFHSFGSGIVVPGTGIALQNRAALFSLEPDHPNVIAPHKRPYHTIIPAMLFKGDDLRLSFGVMGGFMQPQGQVQVVNNIVDFGMNVQQALDAPRFCWTKENTVYIEPGFDDAVISDLRRRGHNLIVGNDLELFGGGQIIQLNPQTGVLTGASEPRKDGVAVGY